MMAGLMTETKIIRSPQELVCAIEYGATIMIHDKTFSPGSLKNMSFDVLTPLINAGKVRRQVHDVRRFVQ